MSLSSKSEVLKNISKKTTLFNVPEFISFSVMDYFLEPDSFILKIHQKFGSKFLAVRSSASDEDGQLSSAAGNYESILGVVASDGDELRSSIDIVISSYREKSVSSDTINQHEIIIQLMVQGTRMSGVIFTHDLNTGAPYYVINYDDVTGSTSSVTSGDGYYANRTLYVHRNSVGEVSSNRFQILLAAVQEIEHLLGSDFLDIEFALDEELTPYLFQARAITTQPNWNRGIAKRIDAALAGIQQFVHGRLKRVSGVFGSTTIFGQMPDWNPAEMIGRAPRALSLSFYRILITDQAWRIARKQMGYAVPHGHPLMVSLAGQPFVDTRLSFHSYLPAMLSSNIAEKLVDSWLARLNEHPALHDKIEFEVAITTYSFDIEQRISELTGNILTSSEREVFKNLLRKQLQLLLTDCPEGGIAAASAKIDCLEEMQAGIDPVADLNYLGALHAQIEEAITYGTVPFSILARHAFIANTLLQSLKSVGILTAEEINQFQASVQTVASELVEDMGLLQRGEIENSVFMKKYGHLRPGTYDILSKRYDQMLFLSEGTASASVRQTTDFLLSEEKTQAIDALLVEHGFVDLTARDLFDYFRNAIAGREYGKFVFTRSVSSMLELIAEFGEQHCLSREELSHLRLQDFLEVANGSLDNSIEDELRRRSEDAAERHAITSAIRLPQVLANEAAVHVVPFQVSHPNFITQKNIAAESVYLITGQAAPKLTGKIVLIENADPGFDWIFAQEIAGLITKYGGANSHMAIRCAEFGIPAAIGCGEQRFEVFVGVNKILLDCATGLIDHLH